MGIIASFVVTTGCSRLWLFSYVVMIAVSRRAIGNKSLGNKSCQLLGEAVRSRGRSRALERPLLRWFPRQMVVPLTYTCTDSRILPFTSFYVGVKVNAVGVKVKVAAQWVWGVKVNMGG